MAVALRKPEPHFADSVLELPLACLIPAEDNPRRQLGDLAELATSIKSVGLIEPIVATPRDLAAGTYTVVAGHRRLAAAAQAGLDYLPVYVKELDDQERLAAMLVENLQRSDLQPLEEAAAFRRLIDEFGMSQRDLSTKVGRSQGHISKRLALVELPKKIRDVLDSGGITVSDALELTKLKDLPKRQLAAFAQGAQWRGKYARAVEHELDEHELEQKIAAATQELTGQGVKVVEYKTQRNSYYPSLTGGAVELDSYEGRQLGLTIAKHKGQPCHAAAVRPRDGRVAYVCTKPASHKGKPIQAPAGEKEQARKEREKQKAAALRAREQNIALGLTLETKLSAPKIDAENMRLIADLLVMEIGTDLAHSSFKFTDDDSQTVLEKKDGTISRIVHVEGNASRQLLDERLAEATTAEEIMGVLLQALIAMRYVNRDAVPQSQRWPDVRGIHRGAYDTAAKAIRTAVEKLARKHAASAPTSRRAPPACARWGSPTIRSPSSTRGIT
jgi:ParB family chromosome partitioning protein